MKKRVFALLLCAAVLFLLLPGRSSADGELIFIAINDTLPQELVNCVVTYGGQTYLPYYAFSNYGLGISYLYFSSASTAYLYTREKQLFFELNTGSTYDGNDNAYSVPAIMRSGTVYLPLNLMYQFFGGFSYSYIAGNEYGSILRLTTAAWLNDAEFLRAAKNTMGTYYREYWAQNQPIETAAPTPAFTPVPISTPASPATPPALPSPTPEPTAEPVTHEGERLTLSFVGPPSDIVLRVLDQAGLSACFFLAADDVRSDPDLIRRAAGEGHSFGVWCTEDFAAEYAETSALLFEAARVRTILTTSPADRAAEFRALAEDAGLIWRYGSFAAPQGTQAFVYQVTAWQDAAGENPSLFLDCAPLTRWGLQEILQYLDDQQYEIVCMRETD